MFILICKYTRGKLLQNRKHMHTYIHTYIRPEKHLEVYGLLLNTVWWGIFIFIFTFFMFITIFSFFYYDYVLLVQYQGFKSFKEN